MRKDYCTDSIKKIGLIASLLVAIAIFRNYQTPRKLPLSHDDINHLSINDVDYHYHRHLAEEVDVSNHYAIFIIINSRDSSYVPVWLEECKAPLCGYQVFADYEVNSANTSNKFSTVVYPDYIRNSTGYSSFGYRGRFQMEWAVENANFDWLVKVDDDGYLCVESLLHALMDDIHAAPKEKFIFGMFHCDIRRIRPDENFYTMSFDVVQYFVRGWNKGLVRFDGRLTLGLNIGVMLSHLHHKCNWTFWNDSVRLLWKRPKGAFDCNRYIWIHHLNPEEINLYHDSHKKHP